MPNNRRFFKCIVGQQEYEALDRMLQIDTWTRKVSTVCHHSGYKRENTESSSFFNLLYIYTEKERALHHS